MLLQSSKRAHVPQKIILDQLVFCQFCVNYLKDWLANNFQSFFGSTLSKFQCGFRKGYGAQNCILVMLETWKEVTDNNKIFGALLTDLSKAFNCLSHELLIAKLHAYWSWFSFIENTTRLIDKWKTKNKSRLIL